MKRFLVIALLAMTTIPALAQSTRARLDDLELRMGQIEETVRGQALVELSQRVDAVSRELRALRGDLEVLQNDRDSLQRELVALRRQNADSMARIEQQLLSLEARANAAPAAPPISVADAPAGAGGATAVVSATSPAAAAPAESAEQLYGRAFDALKAARYPEAIAGMRDFIARHPVHPLIDNAHYWLGQSYFVTRDYTRAIEAFAAVGNDSPDSSKAPDALLKRGICELELGRAETARATFEQVIRRYPEDGAARLAREQLRRMR